MKKFLLIIAVALCGAAHADDIDTTFQFVDADGSIIADGTTITVSALTDDGIQDPFISSGLYVLNTTDETAFVGLDVTVSHIDNGTLSCCFPSNCYKQEAVIEGFDNGKSSMIANEKRNFNTEYFPDLSSYGTCTATFQLRVHEEGELGAGDFKAYGSAVTVNFVYDETSGISAVATSADSEITGYFSVSGEKLSVPQKGVNIVKYAGGKAVKTIMK